VKPLNLRDTGPFSPAEAAQRIKLASKQLKWFTLCHPHWHTAHCRFEWPARYPLPSLPVGKTVRVSTIEGFAGEFKPSSVGEEIAKALVNAQSPLGQIATVGLVIDWLGYSPKKTAGLARLRFRLEPNTSWKITAHVFYKGPIPGEETGPPLGDGPLSPAKGWKATECSARRSGWLDAELSLELDRAQMKTWGSSLQAIMSSQPRLPKTGDWRVMFEYDVKRDEKERSWSVWKPEYTKATAIKGDVKELFDLVNAVNFPGEKTTVELYCTVDKVEDFRGLLEFAVRCAPYPHQPIAIFETDKGKQGFLEFNGGPKGIKLAASYGRNGWETIHEELRRTGGKLSF